MRFTIRSENLGFEMGIWNWFWKSWTSNWDLGNILKILDLWLGFRIYGNLRFGIWLSNLFPQNLGLEFPIYFTKICTRSAIFVVRYTILFPQNLPSRFWFEMGSKNLVLEFGVLISTKMWDAGMLWDFEITLFSLIFFEKKSKKAIL